jgi:hypothetical protein
MRVADFLLALPLLLLCRPWMTGAGYTYVAVAWTVTAFVAMFGDMGLFLSAQDYPLLAPSRNAVTAFFVNLYTWDRFITVAVVANLCAVVWVGVTAFRRAAAPVPKAAEEPRPVWS